MDLTPTAEEHSFREELRAWFVANDPGPRSASDDDDEYFEWRRRWQWRLVELAIVFEELAIWSSTNRASLSSPWRRSGLGRLASPWELRLERVLGLPKGH